MHMQVHAKDGDIPILLLSQSFPRKITTKRLIQKLSQGHVFLRQDHYPPSSRDGGPGQNRTEKFAERG